jgi:hypothetical protein
MINRLREEGRWFTINKGAYNLVVLFLIHYEGGFWTSFGWASMLSKMPACRCLSNLDWGFRDFPFLPWLTIMMIKDRQVGFQSFFI